MSLSDHKMFEDEVRRVARALWPRASGGAMLVGGRERDGIFDDGEIIHIIEATVSQKLEKVRTDLSKSVELIKTLRREQPEKIEKIWIITAHEPTADQQAVVPEFRKKAKCPIEISSFRHFSSKLVDAAAYLSLRQNYAFGSVRNPADDTDISVPKGDYVFLDMVNRENGDIIKENDLLHMIKDIDNSNVIILGEYGSGKSMTLRQLFFDMNKLYLKSKIEVFPVYLNLRDHFGQSDPAEALIRHGNSVGMTDPSQLVAAWRAGYVTLMLDGFDEVSSSRLVRGSGKLKLARRQAVGLVRTFLEQSPRGCKIVASGREHYFDSQDELISALGIQKKDIILSLSEFTQEQIADFLSRKGVKQNIPPWLPSRPLLLGYLVVRGLLDETSPLARTMAQEDGWNYILDRVCEREARQIDPILIDPSLVREFIERLASKARNTTTRRGPIYIQDINSVFETIFDRPSDEKAETLILRLPGLTSSSASESSREFIDDDFVDACRSGDVVRYVTNPFTAGLGDLQDATAQMGALGCRLAAFQLAGDGVTAKQMSAGIAHAASRQNSAALAMDLIRVSQELGLNYIGEKISVSDGFFDIFEIWSSPNLNEICFSECYLERLDIDADARRETSPTFVRCQIEEMIGPLSSKDIPSGIVDRKTEIATYTQDAKTNADILNLDIPMSVRVLMTVLRKLLGPIYECDPLTWVK